MLDEPAQTKADKLGYVPLPDELKQKALEAVESLQIVITLSKGCRLDYCNFYCLLNRYRN